MVYRQTSEVLVDRPFLRLYRHFLCLVPEIKVTYFLHSKYIILPQEFLIGIQDYCEISVKRPRFSQNSIPKMLQICPGIDEYNTFNSQIQRRV
jgi:hypothetical protein